MLSESDYAERKATMWGLGSDVFGRMMAIAVRDGRFSSKSLYGDSVLGLTGLPGAPEHG